MNAGIVKNWKQLVKDDDTVFVLGDLGFCGIEKLRAEIEQLPGQIYVIQGNHDSDKNLAKLKEEGLIKDYCKIQYITIVGDEECPEQDLTLCHFPMIDWYNKEKGAWMVHGHQHQLPETPSCSVKHWDVGLDKNHGRPITFEQLKINITKQYVEHSQQSV